MDREVLATYLDEGQPLGPLASEYIKEAELFQILFEENPVAYKFPKPRPSLIIGRRGSGKTGYLMGLIYSKTFTIADSIRQSDAFEQTVERISVNDDKVNDQTVETIADYWLVLIYLCALRSFHLKYADYRSDFIASFLRKFATIGQTLADFLHGIFRTLHINSKNSETDFFTNVAKSLLSGITNDVDKLEEEVENLLKEKQCTCLITIDTLEDFKLYDIRYRAAVQGLLRAAGALNKPNKRLQIRITMPGEMYRTLHDYSTNVIKDFSNFGILQWHAGDLVSLSAQRYASYLYAHDLGVRDLEATLTSLSDRKNALEFFDSVLPEFITNGFNKRGKSIAYILRHTQLLPRQMLFFLQEMIVLCHARNVNPRYVDEACVKLALKRVEELLVREICQGFNYLYADGLEIARFLKNEMHRTFRQGEFQKTFARKRGKYEISKNLRANDALAQLVNMGAIGKKIQETEFYDVAHFEYVGHTNINFGPEDTLCIHPIFNGKTQIELDTQPPLEGKPIYPYGSDPESSDEIIHLL